MFGKKNSKKIATERTTVCRPMACLMLVAELLVPNG
jgi:hypothetical protein